MPLHTQKNFILKPDWNLMEFVCEDNLLNFRDYEKKWLSSEIPNAGNQPHLSQLACFSHKRIMDISLGCSLMGRTHFDAKRVLVAQASG